MFNRASSHARTLLSVVAIAGLVSACALTDSEDESTGETSSELGGGHGPGSSGHGGPGGGPGGGGHGPGGHGGDGDHHGHRHLGDNGQPRPWGHGHHGNEQVQAPGGIFVANVSANGTGCPDGSWDAAISEDGQTFTLRLNAYEAKVDPNQSRDTKDCQIAVKLTSPEGMAYSVASFFYSGYVFLDQPDMRASYSASYSFLEDPSTRRRADRDMITGPRDESYVFNSDPRPVWSPCGGSSTLQIDTRVDVQNNPAMTGSAFMNNSAIDGAVGDNDGTLAMHWRLGWRRCR